MKLTQHCKPTIFQIKKEKIMQKKHKNPVQDTLEKCGQNM